VEQPGSEPAGTEPLDGRAEEVDRHANSPPLLTHTV
jgi:hypothetical protein